MTIFIIIIIIMKGPLVYSYKCLPSLCLFNLKGRIQISLLWLCVLFVYVCFVCEPAFKKNLNVYYCEPPW